MSPFGHVLDANNRLKDNNAMLNRRRGRMAKLRRMYLESTGKRIRADKTSISPEELRQIKEEIRAGIRKGRIRSFVKAMIITALVVVVLVAGLMVALSFL